MFYNSKEEVLKGIYEQYSKSVDKIVALFASESVLNVILYDSNGTVQKAFIVIKDDDGVWELIDNAQAELVAQFYVAYVSGLLEVVSTKAEVDELDATHLFN